MRMQSDSSSSAPSAPATAVLLVNLGTPDAPTAPAVRRYLAQFLSDRRVVQIARWLWLPLLHGLILPLRSRPVAEKYAQIWMDDGSPLAVHTRRLAEALAPHLPGVQVDWAMRYGQPALSRKLAELQARGVRRVLVLPLYPQYSTTTTASVGDVLAAAPAGLDVRMIDDYHDDPGWVAAIAASIRNHWQQHGRGERLLLSYHGIPQRLIAAGDPYAHQCATSTSLIANALGLGERGWRMSFQSRFGREKWLQPYTMATVQELAAEGVRRIDVACPGFAVDCLETLEEIRIENAKAFQAAGGEVLNYIPCLNDDTAHAEALAALLQRHLQDWSHG